MIINFRQGFLNSQRGSIDFVELRQTSIDLNIKKELFLNFAHGDSNYLVILSNSVENCWNYIDNSWIYWDIDCLTGKLNTGYTKSYLGYGDTFPTSNVVIDSHFFNTAKNKMFVFEGTKWVERIRLFAAKIQNGILFPYSDGSQINDQVTLNIGEIIFDHKDRPIRRIDNESFSFVTKETFNNFQHTNLTNHLFSGVQLRGISDVNNSRFLCVNWSSSNTLKLADNSDEYPAFAMLEEDATSGELIKIITHGFIKNKSWMWLYPENTRLFLGSNGEITTIVPLEHSIQNVGYIVNPSTIYLTFGEQIFINPVEITPTPTPTPTAIL